MIQHKLRSLRKLKSISQREMAKIIGTDASSYSRKERGEVRIFDDEWVKIAGVLEVSVEDVKNGGRELSAQYNQSEEQQGNGIYFDHFPDSLIEIQRKYINLLEKKVESLKAENELLKTRNQ